MFGLAGSSGAFWAGIPVMAFWGLTAPAAQGLMSRRVSALEQGRLQGATSSLMGLAGLLGPGLFTAVFARAIRASGPLHIPGAPYLLAALLLIAALGLASRITRSDRVA
jgi:MFS transporter, DHA1 family, tetracycline resistance protein